MSGEPHYITRAGALKLQEELTELWTKRRKVVQDVADAAAQGDRSENAEYIYGKKKLREIDRRIHFLTKRLETATVVDPADREGGANDRVFFGATVEIEDEDGVTATYRIVGADEIDLASGSISYKSPLARTLLKRKVGETVMFRKPPAFVRGTSVRETNAPEEVELTIVAVRYE